MTSDAGDPAITRLKDFHCPHCGTKSNAAGTVDGEPGAPTPGDVCGCLYCGQPLVFDIDPLDGVLLRLRPMTRAEADVLTDDQRQELARVQFFARHVLPHERASRN